MRRRVGSRAALPGLGALGPEGGGNARKGRAGAPERRRLRGQRVGGAEGGRGLRVSQSAAAASHTLPHQGDESHRAPIAERKGRSLEASAPEERPPLPRGLPAAPGLANPVPSRAGAGG